MDINSFRSAINDGTVEQIENVRQSRYTHLLILREVTAPARFTTDGEMMNTTRIRTGIPGKETKEIRAVDLFYRKQPGAERRIAKSIQRDVLGDDSEDCAEDSMHPNEMRQNSPESVLFGSAAADQGVSQRSRVYYNTAYTLRDAPKVSRQNTQNAPGDENRNVSTEGQGTWTPDFVLPGTLFPSVVTLDSAIPEEVLFVIATLSRTTRYGASETRGGNVANHFLGAFTGRSDGPSNLEVTRRAVGLLAQTDEYDDVESVVEAETLEMTTVAETICQAYKQFLQERGIQFSQVSGEDVSSVAQELQDTEKLRSVMKTQLEAVSDYIERAPGSE